MTGSGRRRSAASLVSCCGLVMLLTLITAQPTEAGTGFEVTVKTPSRVTAPGEPVFVVADARTPYGTPFTLDVYESPWPYTQETLLESLSATASSRATIEVAPPFNTRYRAEIRGLPETSESSKVLVGARDAGTRVQFIGRRRVRATMYLDVSPELPYDFDDRLFFYLVKQGSERLLPVARSRTRLLSGGRVRGSARFKIPRGRYRFYVTWCFEPPRRDNGVGRPQSTHCPRKPVSTDAFGKLDVPTAPRAAWGTARP